MTAPPFVFWTLQRTGGTTLFSFAGRWSNAQTDRVTARAYLHEPFNIDRAFGAITRDFRASKDRVAMHVAVQDALASLPCIKTCYNFLPLPVHNALFKASVENGFRHVVLDRRDDGRRVLSQELANITGAWGPEGAARAYPAVLNGEVHLPPLIPERLNRALRRGERRRQWLRKRLRRAGIKPHILFFEDVFSPASDGPEQVAQMLEYLKIPPDRSKAYQAMLKDALHKKGQDSDRLYQHMPNMDDVTAMLQAHPLRISLWARDSAQSA